MLYAMHSTMLSVSVNIQLIIGYLRFICIVPEKKRVHLGLYCEGTLTQQTD